jgi:hypothetical protein
MNGLLLDEKRGKGQSVPCACFRLLVLCLFTKPPLQASKSEWTSSRLLCFD